MKRVWYTHLDLKPQGPFTLEEMRLKIHRGEVAPTDLISNIEYEEGQWLMAQQWAVFEAPLFPAVQNFIPGMDLDRELKEWVLLAENSESGQLLQEGPLSINDILEEIRKGKDLSRVRAWKPGLSGWARLQDRPEFAASMT